MKTKFVMLIIFAFTTDARIGLAQNLNPPYLSEFPSVEQVKTEITGTDALDSAAQQMSVLLTLKVIVMNLIAARAKHQRTPDETQLMATYMEAYSQLYKLPASPKEEQRFEQLRHLYLDDARIATDDVLAQFFSAEFRRSYYKEKWEDVPSVSEATARRIWQRKLRGHDTFSGKDDFFIYFPPAGGARIYCRQALSGDALPYTVELSYSGLVVTLTLDGKPWSFALQPDGSLQSLEIDTFSWKSGKQCSVGVLRPDPKKSESKAQQNVGSPQSVPAPASKSAPPGVETYLTDGKKALDAADYPKAVEAYKKAISLEPSSTAYDGLGVAYFELKQYGAAVAALQQAIRLEPTDALLHTNLADAYMQMAQYEKAKLSLREALRLKPDHVDTLNLLAVVHFRLKEYSEAAGLFEQAICVQPKNSVLLHNLGKTYFMMGRKEEAKQIYNSLLTIDKVQAQNLYEVMHKVTTSPPAVKRGAPIQHGGNAQDLSREAKRQPGRGASGNSSRPPTPNASAATDAEAYEKQGQQYFYTKDYSRALQAFKHALALKPDTDMTADLNFEIGTCEMKLHDYGGALRSFVEAVRLKPNDSDFNVQLGLAYFGLERYPAAATAFREAIRLRPDFTDAYYSLGLCYVDMIMKNEALEVYRKLRTLDKTTAEGLLEYINKMK